MNGRQAARLAAKKIEEMEHICGRNKGDIVAYNDCIAAMIAGKSPCDWCEDLGECEKGEKGGAGCDEWLLAFRFGDYSSEPAPGGGDGDAGEGLLPDSATGGE